MQYYNVVENVPSTITVENPHLLIITNGLAQGLEQVRLQHVFRLLQHIPCFSYDSKF